MFAPLRKESVKARSKLAKVKNAFASTLLLLIRRLSIITTCSALLLFNSGGGGTISFGGDVNNLYSMALFGSFRVKASIPVADKIKMYSSKLSKVTMGGKTSGSLNLEISFAPLVSRAR